MSLTYTLRFFTALVLVSTLTIRVHADIVTCQYFYQRILGIDNITVDTPNPTSNKTLWVLKTVLSKHYKVHEITPNTTVEAFANFLDLLDPHHALISREDLTLTKYPSRDFFVLLHSQLLSGVISPEYQRLYTLANDRMNTYIKKYLRDSNFRKLVSDRANELLKSSSNVNVMERPSHITHIEARVIDILASQLRLEALKRSQWQPTQVQHADLNALLRNLRSEVILFKKNINEDSLFQVVTKSYLNTFDRHTDMLLPVQQLEHDNLLNKDLSYIGTMSSLVRNGFKIQSVLAGGPAEIAGLKSNDIVTAVEPDFNSGKWYSTRNMGLREYGQMIIGRSGSILRMRVLRDNIEHEFELRRIKSSAANRSVMPSEFQETSNGTIMRIQLKSFSNDSALALRNEIADQMKSKSIQGIVLDLRGNGGGSVSEANDILKLFITNAYSIFTKSKDTITKVMSAQAGIAIWNGPLVVLVDHTSASASEILSSALQAHSRAIIVGGPRTYGKGSAQQYESAGDAIFKYTSWLFYSVDGHPIQWNGVNADIPLPTTMPRYFAFEKDGKNSPRPDSWTQPSEIIWPVIDDLDVLVQVLKNKSAERIQRQKIPKAMKEIHNSNTQEAYHILQDWIEFKRK